MAKIRLSGSDAVGRVAQAKIGYNEAAGNEQQVLVNNTTINNSTGVTSKDFGNPQIFNLILRATVAATFAVWFSIDGITFFHDAGNDIVFAAPADKVVKTSVAANFLRIIPTVAQTTGAYVIATGIY